jgi:hypothetical protein
MRAFICSSMQLVYIRRNYFSYGSHAMSTSFIDVDGLFVCLQMVEIHHDKKINNIINIILNFQKNWIMFIMISKIKLKISQINLILKLFMCLMLELL